MSLHLFVTACLFVLPSPPEDPVVLANQLLTQGSALFDKHDAAMMAWTYVENGEVQLIIKEQNSDTYKREVRTGRTAIQEGYADIFKDMTPSTHSRNVVESARFVGTTVLVIQGTFQPDTNKADTVPFVQVRVKDGRTWKLLSVQLYVLPQS
jgi:hypothetical protein